jgi:transcription factor Dp-1
MAECTPKDEQNIKRRVYDALNVMIASGVLRKENKKVLSDNAFRGKSKSDYRRGELQALHEDM